MPQSVSLIDLAPTLTGLAHDGDDDDDVATDGRSLLPHLSGTGGHDEAFGEYMGEAAAAPIFMIRRGRLKYVASAPDPEQLYDLAADPAELANLAGEAAHAKTLAAFRREAEERWDAGAIEAAVLASQRRRRLVHRALMTGRHRPWDFQPVVEASQRYMRNHLDLPEVERRARLPRRDEDRPA